MNLKRKFVNIDFDGAPSFLVTNQMLRNFSKLLKDVFKRPVYTDRVAHLL